MNKEERKNLARCFGMGWADAPLCERYYPKCCQYHEGFDDCAAEFLPDLEQVGWRRSGEKVGHERNANCEVWKCVPVYVVREGEHPPDPSR